METIKVNLHGHLLADFGPWWKRQFGIEGKNLAEVVAEKCFRKGIGIYAITNDSFWNFTKKSRFSYMVDYARSSSQQYKMDMLGQNAFIMERGKNQIVFLSGQSIRVRYSDREYELLTFGSDQIPNGMSFSNTFARLKYDGLLGVAEHPFAEGHHGAMSENLLLELWNDGEIDAVEHNAKIAVPEFLATLPIRKFRDYSRKHNRHLAEIARSNNIPLIANDDSDGISHIGTAYTEFDINKIRLDKDENIIQDINKSIKNNDFTTHRGHLNVFSFMRYAAWILTIKDHGLGLRAKYDKKHLIG